MTAADTALSERRIFISCPLVDEARGSVGIKAHELIDFMKLGWSARERPLSFLRILLSSYAFMPLRPERIVSQEQLAQKKIPADLYNAAETGTRE